MFALILTMASTALADPHIDTSAAIGHLNKDNFDLNSIEFGVQMPVVKPVGVLARYIRAKSNDPLNTDHRQLIGSLFVNRPNLGGLFLDYTHAEHDNGVSYTRAETYTGLTAKAYLGQAFDLNLSRTNVERDIAPNTLIDEQHAHAELTWYPHHNLALSAAHGLIDIDQSYDLKLLWQPHDTSRLAYALLYQRYQDGHDAIGVNVRYYFQRPKSLQKRVRKDQQ